MTNNIHVDGDSYNKGSSVDFSSSTLYETLVLSYYSTLRVNLGGVVDLEKVDFLASSHEGEILYFSLFPF